jgi:hypothetical protein
MKVFFDTNVYVAEALLGQVAEQLERFTVGLRKLEVLSRRTPLYPPFARGEN